MLFLNMLKISKISLLWKFWKKNWLCLASWALFILKLYKAFQTTVQITMVIKVIIKVWSKFQSQIPLQIYWKLQKVQTCDGNGLNFWQVPPYFNLRILVTILFFHDWNSIRLFTAPQQTLDHYLGAKSLTPS